MKYIFATVFCAALLLAGVVSTGHQLDLGSTIGILFAALLPGWLIWDYRESPRASRLPRLATAQPSQSQPARPAKPARTVVFTPPPLAPRPIAAPALFPRRVTQPQELVLPLPSN